MAAFKTSTTPGPCPTDEELAAFLDGMLPKAERERITAHLADCESCYEIFAGAVQFQQDSESVDQEGTVVPFPSNKDGGLPARRRWWIPAAAAAVLAVGLGFAGYRVLSREPKIETAALVATFQSKAAAASHPYPYRVTRGDKKPTDLVASAAPSTFMVGVLLVDLRVDWTGGEDATKIAERLTQIGNELDQAGPLSGHESYQADAATVRAHGIAALGSPAAALSTREAGLDDYFLDNHSFDFGKWAEAGRRAALTQTPGFFKSRDYRHFLSIILREKEEDKKARDAVKRSETDDLAVVGDGEREDEVLDHLRAIAALWDSGDLQTGSYRQLADHFSSIIGKYDR